LQLRKEHIMKVIVFGGVGMLGSAITRELRSHGHSVVTAGRSGCDHQIDFRYATHAEDFLPLVRDADIVVNAVGILIERGDDRFDTVHVAAPRALFEACAKAHVARVVQVSALGAGRGTRGRYIKSKEAAEAALAEEMTQASGDWVSVRPSLLIQKGSPSTQLFTHLARLPIIGLPGMRASREPNVAPMRCEDAAAAIVRICEHPKALRRVIEIAGSEELSYGDFLRTWRAHLGLRPALTIRLPWWLMHITAKIAELFPQKTISADGLHVLRAGLTTSQNESLYWLRSMPKPVFPIVESAQGATKNIVTATH
jgi:uncharacterized protein YbjT (DUF2867 family)